MEPEQDEPPLSSYPEQTILSRWKRMN